MNVSASLSTTTVQILEAAVSQAQQWLQQFAHNPEFAQKMATAFGETINPEPLKLHWLANDFSILNQIEVLNSGELNGADGAYAAATDTIYLPQEFLLANANHLEQITAVLLEEAGHRIDTQLNQMDAPGDEGAIFSALVRNQVLTEEELSLLKLEDDSATITLNGQQIQVEQSYTVFDPKNGRTYSNTNFPRPGETGEPVHGEIIGRDNIAGAYRFTTLDYDEKVGFRARIGDNTGNPTADVDLVGITLKAGEFLLIDIDAQDNDGRGRLNDQAGSLNALLRIFDSNGREIAIEDNSIDPDSGLRIDANGNDLGVGVADANAGADPAFAFVAPADGIYYIGISAAGNRSYNPFLGNAQNSDLARDTWRDGGSSGWYELELTKSRTIKVPVYANDASPVVEGNNLTFRVDSVPSNIDLNVQYNTANGTAFSTPAANPDFEGQPGTLPIAKGSEINTIVIRSVDDLIVEQSPENFTLFLQPGGQVQPILNPRRGIDGSGQGRIIDNDGPPVFWVNDVAVVEGTGGSNSLVFTISLSQPSSVEHSISYTTVDNTAVAGTDYQFVSDTLRFAPGVTSLQTRPISITTDNIVELDETFFLNLFNPTGGAGIADGQGVGTLINDDTASIIISDPSTVEGGSLNFTVTLSNPVDVPITVNYATADGTVTGEPGYPSSSGSLTFTPGQLSQTISIPTNDDNIVELDETLFVNLSNLNNGGRDVRIDDPQGIGTIIDNDEGVITIDDVTVVEGGPGQTSTATFTVRMSNPADAPVSFNYTTADSTATGGVDYGSLTSTVTFNPGQTSQTISVPIVGDNIVELNETFFVNLSNLNSGGRKVSFGDNQGMGTIIDEDPASITISDSSVVEGGQAQFTVTLSNPVDVPITFTYTTADGTATGGVDYGSLTSTVTFNPGQPLSQTILIPTLDDTLVEPPETFFVNLSNLNNGGRNVGFGDDQGLGTIADNDEAEITIDNVSMTEGNDGQKIFTFNVNLSRPVDSPVTLSYTTVDGNISRNIDGSNDYIPTSGTLTFARGQTTTQTISVSVNGDIFVEPDETFFVKLNNLQANGLSVYFQGRQPELQGPGTILNDDFPPINCEGKPADIFVYSNNLIEGDPLRRGQIYRGELGGTTGDDIIVSTNVNDTITGGTGDDAICLLGGKDTVVIRPGDGNDRVYGFTGVGTGVNPSEATIAAYDILRFQGSGLIARNMLLTQIGNDLLVSFEDVANTSVTLKNFALQDLDNLPNGEGNILFNGDLTIQDSFDVFNADDTPQEVFNSNRVTFLNDLNNDVRGFDDSDDVINGQGGNDILRGLSGNDLLRGGEGNDSLIGGAGNDTLVGGLGQDQFVFGSNFNAPVSSFGIDTIRDFQSGVDKVVLGAGTFRQLNATSGGGLAAGDFAVINQPTNGSAGSLAARIIYNQGTGDLFYNPNRTSAGFGSGGGLFATLTGAPALNANDFLV